MAKKIQTLRAIRPNKGIEMAYRKKLMKLVDEMQHSVKYWIEAEYKKQEPVIIADDATPADAMARALRKRFTQWQRNFNRQAKKLAEWFVRQNYKYTESAFKDAWRSYKSQKFQQKLEDLGFAIDLKMTPAMLNVMKSFIHENVNLIKSIPEKYFTEVEGMVMRSVRSGRDLQYLTDELEHRYGVTHRRAILIARDQNNKATEQMNRTRQMDLGIKKGIWVHASGVKDPRDEDPDNHVAANGKPFDLDKGYEISPGKFIFPGEEINCFPSDAKVDGFSRIEKLYRRFYTGKLTRLRTADGNTILRTTPNHQCLTLRGWVKACELQVGDELLCIKQERGFVRNRYQDQGIKFEDFFNSISGFSASTLVTTTCSGDFHGDSIKNQEVDIVLADGFLRDEFDSLEAKSISKKLFVWPIIRGDFISFARKGAISFLRRIINFSSNCIVCGLSIKPFLFRSSVLSGKDISILGIAGLNAEALEDFINRSSVAGKVLTNRKDASARGKKRNYFSFLLWCKNLFFAHNKINLSTVKIDNIDNEEYSGFVYNIQTKTNYYTINSCIVHNCHCYYRPIIEEFL